MTRDIRWQLWLAVAAAVTAAATLLIPAGLRFPGLPAVGLAGAAAALIAAAVAWFARRSFVAVDVVTGLVVAGAAAWAWWAAVQDRLTGFPTARMPVLAAALTLALVGILGLAGRRLIGQVVAIVLVATGAAGLVLGVPAVRGGHAGTAAPPPPVDRPAGVAWQRDVPDPLAVVGLGTDRVAVADGTEVQALDARTGEVRWRYDRPHAAVSRAVSWLKPSPDGRWLAVPFGRGDGADGPEPIVVLDAVTGRERWWRAEESAVAALTNDVVVLAALDTGSIDPYSDLLSLTAYGLADGKRRWDHRPPPGCELDSHGIRAVAGRVWVPSRCDGTIRADLLDDADGGSIHQFGYPQGESGEDARAALSAEGLLLLDVPSRGPDPVGPMPRLLRVIDLRTGRAVANLDIAPGEGRAIGPGGAVLWYEHPRQYLTSLDLETRHDVLGDRHCDTRDALWTAAALTVVCISEVVEIRRIRPDGTDDGGFALDPAVGRAGPTARPMLEENYFVPRKAGPGDWAGTVPVLVDVANKRLIGLA